MTGSVYGARWRRLREVHLRREPLCRICASMGRTEVATVVDHIEPHRGRHSLMYDAANLQSLCETCHNAVKQAQERGGVVRGATVDGVPLDAGHHWNDGGHGDVGDMLILVRGLSGAGKSTVARHLAESMGATHVENDDYFEGPGAPDRNDTTVKEAVQHCIQRTEDYLQRGRTVVVANAFVRSWELDPYVQLAKRLSVPVQIIEVWSGHRSVHDVDDEYVDWQQDNFEPTVRVWPRLKAAGALVSPQ